MVLLAGWDCGLYSSYDMAIASHWSSFIAEF